MMPMDVDRKKVLLLGVCFQVIFTTIVSDM
jgi:hypothetical protein